ncbi:hypothetical protein SDC9_118182 [bioreactor metagenome]|uniref:Uncharacterized protein n=1 Tax=bioreactor metagenome TaxID=1076179 RepID=A0A645C0R3_9ZZZZ
MIEIAEVIVDVPVFLMHDVVGNHHPVKISVVGKPDQRLRKQGINRNAHQKKHGEYRRPYQYFAYDEKGISTFHLTHHSNYAG